MRKLFVVLFIFFLTACNNMYEVSIKTANGDRRFDVELALTDEELQRGLMYRQDLPERRGMFFVYDRPSVLSFWMKNTLVPLDMIFIDENKKIVHIERHATPCPQDSESCPVYSSEYPVKYVLEIGADLVNRHGIKEGDEIILNFEI